MLRELDVESGVRLAEHNAPAVQINKGGVMPPGSRGFKGPRRNKDIDVEIEIREPGPPKHRVKGRWITILTPLLKQPYRNNWCMVRVFDKPEQATAAAENLSARKVLMPAPEHDWSFAARGLEVFAIYHGPKRPSTRKPTTGRPAAKLRAKAAKEAAAK
jgi:hypothetical protein